MVYIDNVGLVSPVEFIFREFFQVILQGRAYQEFLILGVYFQVDVIRLDKLYVFELDAVIQVLLLDEDGVFQHRVGHGFVILGFPLLATIGFSAIGEIGKCNLYGRIQVLLLKGFYQVAIGFEVTKIKGML